jgi:phytoene synthase
MVTGIEAKSWEDRLLALAREAERFRDPGTSQPTADPDRLATAYHYCEAIVAQHSRTFSLASGLLPSEKRRAARALYAFCRVTDDVVDVPTNDPASALDEWRRSALDDCSSDPVIVAWTDTRRRYGIPVRYAKQLIDGVGLDLVPRRYQTFGELASYAYGVASTVGLMLMHIVGYTGPDAIPYAIKLGIALQLTNILRDVGEDWRAGRLYLPVEELEAYGLTDVDLTIERVDARWRDFMRFQIDQNRRLYAEAWPGIAMLSRDGRFAVTAAADLYRAILDDVEAHDYDVFSRRAHVSALKKLRRLPRIWWLSRRMVDGHATL